MCLIVGGFFIRYEINIKNKYRGESGIAKAETETEEWGTSKKAYGVYFRRTRRQHI